MNVSESRSIDEIVTSGYSVRLWDYLREGWNVFMRWPLAFFGIAIITAFVSSALEITLPTAWLLAGAILWSILPASLALLSWALLRSGSVACADALMNLKTAGRLVLCYLATTVLVLAWYVPLLFCIRAAFSGEGNSLFAIFLLPPLSLAAFVFSIGTFLALVFTYLLIAERSCGMWLAIKGSVRVANKNWGGVCALGLLQIVVPVFLGYLVEAMVAFPLDRFAPDFFPVVTVGAMPYLELLGEPFDQAMDGIPYNLGELIGRDTGTAFGTALSSCILAIAYADIFGLRRRQKELTPTPL